MKPPTSPLSRANGPPFSAAGHQNEVLYSPHSMPGNHNKKPSERRDSLKQQQQQQQQQRKNNPTGNKSKDPQPHNTNTSSNKHNNLHTSHRANTPPAAATTATITTTTITTTATAAAFSTGSGSSTPSTPPLSHTAQPVAATAMTSVSNGFNTYAVTQFLNKRFSDTFAAYHDDANPETRPKKHESQEKAWGNKGGLPSVWGQKSGLMANGNDMFTELLK